MFKIAIIGTRKLKESHADIVFKNIKKYLSENNLKPNMVRSGNAVGTDQLANRLVDDSTTIAHYLPWIDYNQELKSRNPRIHYLFKKTNVFDDKMYELFPFIKGQRDGVISLIRRNFQIIMGIDGDKPVDLVFWHTNSNKPSGGTMYGVILARHLGIKDVRV
jgi:hypothetical protein